MADYTGHLNLKKPLRTEPYSVADANGNMDILDANVGRNNEDIKNHKKRIKLLEEAAKGKLFTTDTDTDTAYIKDVPAGALPSAILNKLGGRTIVGNQLVQNGNFESTNNWEGNFGTLSVANNIATVVASGNAAGINQTSKHYFKNHKYYFSLDLYRISDGLLGVNNGLSLNVALGTGIANTWTRIQSIKEETTGGNGKLTLFNANYSAGDTCKFRNVRVIDLTQMFGAGNEPSTVAEVEAIIGTDYIDYNTGSLESADTSKIVSYKADTTVLAEKDIPQAIQDLDGYGWSAGSYNNDVDYANKKYVQQVVKLKSTDFKNTYTLEASGDRFLSLVSLRGAVGKRELADGIICNILSTTNKAGVTNTNRTIATRDWDDTQTYVYISDGIYADINEFKAALDNDSLQIYFALATPIETDLSDIINDNMLEVEADGTIEFVGNEDYNIPVPSEEVFCIKIADAI